MGVGEIGPIPYRGPDCGAEFTPYNRIVLRTVRQDAASATDPTLCIGERVEVVLARRRCWADQKIEEGEFPNDPALCLVDDSGVLAADVCTITAQRLGDAEVQLQVINFGLVTTRYQTVATKTLTVERCDAAADSD